MFPQMFNAEKNCLFTYLLLIFINENKKHLTMPIAINMSIVDITKLNNHLFVKAHTLTKTLTIHIKLILK